MAAFDTLSRATQLRRLRALARAALAQYDIPVRRVAAIQHEANTTFRVEAEDGGRYVMRVVPPPALRLDAARSEAAWLAALRRDTALGVPEPIPTRAGALATVAQAPGVPEPRTCVLFRWLDGRFLEKELTPAHLRKVGEFTARLQDHASQWQPPDGFSRGRVEHMTAHARRSSRYEPGSAADAAPTRDEAEQAIRLVSEHCSPQDGERVSATLQRVWAMQRELGTGPEAFGLIHADLHHENYLFHRGEVRAIDFDDCGYGHFLYDLGVTLIETSWLPQFPALRAALLEGYRSLRPLPADLEAHFPTFFALRRLQLLVWIVESRDHPAFRDEWRESARDQLDPLDAFLAS